MSLIRSKPRKKIRLAVAAEMIGCSSESLRCGRIGNFKTFRLKEVSEGAKSTSPLYVWEADVRHFLEKLENGEKQ